MSLSKFGTSFTIAALAILCASYANSASKKMEWRSSAWLGGCRLSAQVSSAGSFDFVPSTESRTKFNSPWPSEPGELYLSVREPVAGEPLLGAVEPSPRETLRIRFVEKDGELQPVSYVYENIKSRAASGGLITEKSCVSLIRVKN